MTISMTILALYVVVILIISYRVWIAFKATVDTVYDREVALKSKLLHNRHGMWSKTTTAMVDIGMSLAFALLFSAIIASIGAAAVGAFAGIMVSLMLTGSRRYVRKKRNQ